MHAMSIELQPTSGVKLPDCGDRTQVPAATYWARLCTAGELHGAPLTRLALETLGGFNFGPAPLLPFAAEHVLPYLVGCLLVSVDSHSALGPQLHSMHSVVMLQRHDRDAAAPGACAPCHPNIAHNVPMALHKSPSSHATEDHAASEPCNAHGALNRGPMLAASTWHLGDMTPACSTPDSSCGADRTG